MSWNIPRKTVTAAHEIGHALVAHHFKSEVGYISNIENVDFTKEPHTNSNMARIDPFDRRLIFAAGVGGVMFWRRSVAGRIGLNKYGRRALSGRLGYCLSQRGSSKDRKQFANEHLAEGAPALSFYASAAKSLEILTDMEPLFVSAMEALQEHTFISKFNFEGMVIGRAFDEQENKFEKVKQIDALWFNTKAKRRRWPPRFFDQA